MKSAASKCSSIPRTDKMGSWTQNWALRSCDRDTIRQCVIDWMRTKGFVPNTEPRLFACEEQNEHGFYLFGNATWSVVLYSRKLPFPFHVFGLKAGDCEVHCLPI